MRKKKIRNMREEYIKVVEQKNRGCTGKLLKRRMGKERQGREDTEKGGI